MIDKLEMFLALAEARHFGRAAEAAGVAQPTLSAAIRSLEDQLGVPLVRRGSRFEGLTPEGERALHWARRMVADARALREEMRTAREGLSGTLRLGVIPTALAAAARLTAAFAARHARVRVTVLSAPSTAILDGLDALTLDAGITYLDAEPLGRRTTQALYEERHALVLRDDHPFAGRAALPWAALGEVPLALLTPEMQNRRIIGALLAAAGVEAAPRIETNSTIALVGHVLDGGWATVLPLGAAEPFLSHPRLRALPLRDPDARHRVGLVAPAREPLPPLVAALMAEAREAPR
ncbi:LysR family transcriptional regulator [Rubellimicrobium sp. CFH 75288]|uniref:LysR family transcriptional regulator n=1 Tax=Rubellimicrobium sp. CFH 75288 TaxID=2697034 RepID=UPI00141214B2|nr:LysR family transcriptional regulator [Rubellimicrobium sp. CFH 75288]